MAFLAIAAVALEWWKFRTVAMEVILSEEGLHAITAGGAAMTLRWSEIGEIRRFAVLRAYRAFEVVRLLADNPPRQILVTSVMGEFESFMEFVVRRATEAKHATALRWWERLFEWGVL